MAFQARKVKKGFEVVGLEAFIEQKIAVWAKKLGFGGVAAVAKKAAKKAVKAPVKTMKAAKVAPSTVEHLVAKLDRIARREAIQIGWETRPTTIGDDGGVQSFEHQPVEVAACRRQRGGGANRPIAHAREVVDHVQGDQAAEHVWRRRQLDSDRLALRCEQICGERWHRRAPYFLLKWNHGHNPE